MNRTATVAVVALGIFDVHTGTFCTSMQGVVLTQGPDGDYTVRVGSTAKGINVRQSFDMLHVMAQGCQLRLGAVFLSAGVSVREGLHLQFRCDKEFDVVRSAVALIAHAAAERTVRQ